MQDIIFSVKDRWDALCREVLQPGKELKILALAALADDVLEAIGQASLDPMNRAFREALPVSVARVTQQAQDEMMRYAENPYACFERANDRIVVNSLDAAEDKYRELFRQDMERIHAALFNVPYVYGAEAEMRIKAKAKVGVLHQDSAGEEYPNEFAASYICRVGAAAALCMAGKEQLNASPEIQQLIEDARAPLFAAKREKAIAQLCARKILVPNGLGDVTLLLARNCDAMGIVGTLHCSPPTPPDDFFSAFLHVRGLIS